MFSTNRYCRSSRHILCSLAQHCYIGRIGAHSLQLEKYFKKKFVKIKNFTICIELGLICDAAIFVGAVFNGRNQVGAVFVSDHAFQCYTWKLSDFVLEKWKNFKRPLALKAVHRHSSRKKATNGFDIAQPKTEIGKFLKIWEFSIGK